MQLSTLVDRLVRTVDPGSSCMVDQLLWLIGSLFDVLFIFACLCVFVCGVCLLLLAHAYVCLI